MCLILRVPQSTLAGGIVSDSPSQLPWQFWGVLVRHFVAYSATGINLKIVSCEDQGYILGRSPTKLQCHLHHSVSHHAITKPSCWCPVQPAVEVLVRFSQVALLCLSLFSTGDFLEGSYCMWPTFNEWGVRIHLLKGRRCT